jgi:hypothetical protein
MPITTRRTTTNTDTRAVREAAARAERSPKLFLTTVSNIQTDEAVHRTHKDTDNFLVTK